MRQFLARLAENVDWLCLGGTAAAWVGLWGAWIPHPTAALTHNAVDLAEWAGFLSDVQFGDLRGMPDMLRVGIAAASIALAFSAGAIKKPTLRWGVRLLSLIMVIVLLPPYPEIFELWRSDNYGVRFVVAVGALVGLVFSGLADVAPVWVRRVGVAITGPVAIWQALRAYLAFRTPFSAHYAYPTPYPIQPGWGVSLFVGGLIVAGVSAIYAILFTPRSL